jgi:hypothetical protein
VATNEEEIECPRMLKDLLVTPELLDTLGEDMIFILRLMIGPPTGIQSFPVNFNMV